MRRAALAKGGDSRPVRRQLASVLEQQERLVEAEAMLAALESESGDPELPAVRAHVLDKLGRADEARAIRSEEHTSELQSLMRPSNAGFCLKTTEGLLK